MSIAIRRSTKLWPAPTGNDFSMPRSDISGWLPVGSHGASVSAEEDERLNSMSDASGIKLRAAQQLRDFVRFYCAFVRCRELSSHKRTPSAEARASALQRSARSLDRADRVIDDPSSEEVPQSARGHR